MSNISEKTLNDLEFNTILQSVQELCISELGKEAARKIKPIKKNQKRRQMVCVLIVGVNKSGKESIINL